MKKAILSILAFIGMTQASYADAYYTKDNFESASGTINLEDVAYTFSSDAFAISFELDRCLTDINSSNEFFTLVLGGSSDTYKVSIVSMMGIMTLSVGNNATAAFTYNPPNTSGPLVLQIEDNGVATLLYNNNGTLEQIMKGSDPVYKVPDVINYASLTLNGVTASNITTWTGVVTAADLANPTPAPSPGVPEPTTATLSLLTLAGLTSRRRRK